MGKGNRNSQKRLENQMAMEEKLLAKEKAEKGKKSSDRAIAITCLVIAIMVVAILVVNVLGETGVFIRGKEVYYIKGNENMKVNAPMMTFFINDRITSWYSQYEIYVTYGLISVDFSKSLKDQKLTTTDRNYLSDAGDSETWYDYFVGGAQEDVQMYLLYANAGAEVGGDVATLSSDDKDEINNSVKAIKDSLRKSGASIADQYGKGVTEGDIRDCYELMIKARKFSEYILDKETKEVEKDADAITDYRDKNPEDFKFAKYLSYTISVSAKNKTEKQFIDEVENAKLAAQKLQTATSPEHFATLVELYKKSKTEFIKDMVTGTETGDVTEAAAEAVTETSTEKETETTKLTVAEEGTSVEELVDKYTSTIYYDTSDEFGKWVFESASVNDKYVEEETGVEKVTQTTAATSKDTEETTETKTETETKPSYETETASDGSIVYKYKTFTTTVYILKDAPGHDNRLTHDFAYMITDNKSQAEAFLKEFLSYAKDEQTRDKFDSLAKKHYELLHKVDKDGNHNHADNEKEPIFEYGMPDRAKADYFNDSYDALNEWLEDKARVNGEVSELMEIKVDNSDGTKTSYYAVLLFEKNRETAWYVDALNGKVQENIDELYKKELNDKLGYDKYVFDSLDYIGK